MADLTHDLLALGELQIQLLGVDLREGSSRCVLPMLLILAGLVLALGSVPVLLLGVGWLLVNQAGISEQAAFIGVALVTIAAAGGVSWTAWRKLKAATLLLTRSQSEFRENIRWIKKALKGRAYSEARSETEMNG